MRRLVLTLLAFMVPLACGGRSQETEEGSGGKAANGGKGGADTGGTGAKGGTGATGGTATTGGANATGATGGKSDGGTGVGATGGTVPVAGAGPDCCLAYPTCGPGEVEYQGPCAPELGCRAVTLCCTTIQCIPEQLATGGTGGTGGAGGGGGSGGDIPPEAGVDCNPELEHNRSYIGDAGQCTVILFACTSPTVMFGNDCGCGCEQDAACPPSFDCGPNARLAAPFACTPENLARCPFSEVLE